MSLLEVNQTQAEILKHKDRLQKTVNQSISTLNATLNEIDKLISYLHTESEVEELVDKQDRNKFLGYLGRKVEVLTDIAEKITAQGALKGDTNADTKTNVDTFITDTSYNHDNYKVNFESD